MGLLERFTKWYSRSSVECWSASFSEALTGEIDAVRVVNDAIQDGVGQSRISYYFIPTVHGDLAGDEDGAAVVAIFDDLQQIAPAIGGERLRAPYVDGSLLQEVELIF